MDILLIEVVRVEGSLVTNLRHPHSHVVPGFCFDRTIFGNLWIL